MRKSLLIALCITPFVSEAQNTLRGSVYYESEEPAAYIPVSVLNTDRGAYTDSLGYFVIKNIPDDSCTISIDVPFYKEYVKEIFFEGEAADTIHVRLRPAESEMDEVVISNTKRQVTVTESPVKTEIISEEYLERNQTSNIINALSTVNGLQQQINCGVCGTNNIRINGLEGPYTLVLIDGMPIMSSLAAVYGFNGIPVSIVDQIEIVKGPSSVLYGSEAVGGLINIVTKNPAEMPLLDVNSFVTSHREFNTDIAFSPDISDRLSTTFSGNFFHNSYRMDHNNDNFADIPLSTRLSLFNKWNLKRRDKRKASLAIRYYTEKRLGGTMEYTEKNRGSDSVYGESIKTERFELIGKYQIPSEEEIFLDYSFNRHHQDSYYGDTHYQADQMVYFSNIRWDKEAGNHDLLFGGTLRYQTYEDNSPADTDERRFIPGLFLQDQVKISEKTTILAGARADHHDEHGIIISPRANLKQGIGDYTTLRVNLGTGFRHVNLFTEEHAALTGARSVLIRDNISPERSYNASLSVCHSYYLFNSVGDLDVDVFYTYFDNKIIPDYDSDPNLIIYDNLTGYGISRGASITVSHNFSFPLDVQMGATYQNVFQVKPEGDNKVPQPFAPVFSGTFIIGYQWEEAGLTFDYSGNVTGPQHLPESQPPFMRPEQSSWYTLQNFQVTKNLSENIEVYSGIKNIFNYTQESPLVNPEAPFSDTFDTAYVWGPLQTRRFYVGVSISWRGTRNNG